MFGRAAQQRNDSSTDIDAVQVQQYRLTQPLHFTVLQAYNKTLTAFFRAKFGCLNGVIEIWISHVYNGYFPEV